MYFSDRGYATCMVMPLNATKRKETSVKRQAYPLLNNFHSVLSGVY